MSSTDNKSEKFLREGDAPPFLKIFGFKGAHYNSEDDTFTCEFDAELELTHANGMVVQGGFVTGMLDSCMAQFLIYRTEGTQAPLSLDIDVKFFNICTPGPITAIAKIIKQGKSIAFTEASIFQNNKLIASSTSTNKLVPLRI